MQPCLAVRQVFEEHFGRAVLELSVSRESVQEQELFAKRPWPKEFPVLEHPQPAYTALTEATVADQVADLFLASVTPSPATHASLNHLKTGETLLAT